MKTGRRASGGQWDEQRDERRNERRNESRQETSMLNTEPNLTRPDDFYEALIDMHRDLDEAQSQSANAQLILLLANHVGNHEALMEAIRYARAGVVALSSKDTADTPHAFV
jgi:hypothetical protein